MNYLFSQECFDRHPLVLTTDPKSHKADLEYYVHCTVEYHFQQSANFRESLRWNVSDWKEIVEILRKYILKE